MPPAVRLSIDKALSRAECRSRNANSLTHLVRECEMHMPAALVIEAELLDENAKSLVDDLRRHMRNFVMIEIVKQANVYDVSLPGTKGSCRLSAANIETNLRDAMMFELAQA
jgi:erythromycin esterase-like protein